MRRQFLAAFALTAVVLATMAAPARSHAQDQAAAPVPQVNKDQIVAFAKVQIAIAKVRDEVQAELAQVKNKTPEAQTALREKLVKQIEEILHHNLMTEADYQRATYLVSVDPDRRKVFDDALVELTGVVLPAQQAAAASQSRAGGRGGAPAAAPVAVPAGPLGTHLGHILNAFNDTPNMQGLLPLAVAEAGIAAQHAMLALRNPGNLDQLKLHAGHVIHAIDPTVVTSGPGQGYGVKRAATTIVTHIDLAAKTPGAPAAATTHAAHIGTSAKNVISRSDQILTLAKQVQAATSAEAAAGLMNQVSSLAAQLVAGADANGDGRVGWQDKEGGLQHVDEHIKLLIGG